MSYLCCTSCRLRLPRGASGGSLCPSCDRPLELTSARAALGFRLLELPDPVPLTPAAAAMAVALTGLLPTAR